MSKEIINNHNYKPFIMNVSELGAYFKYCQAYLIEWTGLY
jgi:hypothetical protein